MSEQIAQGIRDALSGVKRLGTAYEDYQKAEVLKKQLNLNEQTVQDYYGKIKGAYTDRLKKAGDENAEVTVARYFPPPMAGQDPGKTMASIISAGEKLDQIVWPKEQTYLDSKVFEELDGGKQQDSTPAPAAPPPQAQEPAQASAAVPAPTQTPPAPSTPAAPAQPPVSVGSIGAGTAATTPTPKPATPATIAATTAPDATATTSATPQPTPSAQAGPGIGSMASSGPKPPPKPDEIMTALQKHGLATPGAKTKALLAKSIAYYNADAISKIPKDMGRQSAMEYVVKNGLQTNDAVFAWIKSLPTDEDMKGKEARTNKTTSGGIVTMEDLSPEKQDMVKGAAEQFASGQIHMKELAILYGRTSRTGNLLPVIFAESKKLNPDLKISKNELQYLEQQSSARTAGGFSDGNFEKKVQLAGSRAGATARAIQAPDIQSSKIDLAARTGTAKILNNQDVAAKKALGMFEKALEEGKANGGGYANIPKWMYRDLASDYATLMQMGMGKISEGSTDKVQQWTVQGNVVDLWNGVTGNTHTTEPFKVLELMHNRIKELKNNIDSQLKANIQKPIVEHGDKPPEPPAPPKGKDTLKFEPQIVAKAKEILADPNAPEAAKQRARVVIAQGNE